VSYWIRQILSCRKPGVETSHSRSHFWSAIDALRAISQWPDGVAALADIDVFEELQHLDHNHLPELRGNITLLLDAVLKHTPDDSPDLVSLPQLVPRVQNLAQLDSQLVFKPGDEVVSTPIERRR
jgi:hypothetical protein